MFTGLPGQEIMYTTSFVGKGIKVPFENKSNGPHSKKLGHPVSLSFFFFFSLFTLFQADPLEHRGSLHSLICPGF